MTASGSIVNPSVGILPPTLRLERTDLRKVEGTVCYWKGVQDPLIADKKWSVLLAHHQQNGCFSTLATNGLANEDLVKTPATLLNTYADVIANNMQIDQAKKVEIIRENYTPYIVAKQDGRIVLFEPKYRIFQLDTRTGSFAAHNFIVQDNEVWDLITVKEKNVEEVIVVPVMKRLLRPYPEMPETDWETSVQKIQMLGNRILMKYSCPDGTKNTMKIAQGWIEHKWETQEGSAAMIMTTEPLRSERCDFNLVFYSQALKFSETTTIKAFDLTELRFEPMDDLLSDVEKFKVCRNYTAPDYRYHTFIPTATRSCFDPEKLISWYAWAVTFVDCGHALGSGSLNSINPIGIGHACLVIEGMDYDRNVKIFKAHAVNVDGKLMPEWAEWPNFDPARINGKSDTFLIPCIAARALEKYIENVVDGQEQISEDFALIGFSDGSTSSALYSVPNCTAWALRALKPLGITLPQTSFEKRHPLSNLLSGFKSGMDIDLKGLAAPTSSLITPDLYARPQNQSTANQALNYGTYGLGYAVGSIPSVHAQLNSQYEKATGISLARWISILGRIATIAR